MSRQKIISLISGLLIGIILLVIWLIVNPPQEIVRQCAKVNLNWVLLASVVYLSAYFIRSTRWRLLLPESVNPGLITTWFYAMGGNLINYLIPIRAGDVARAWFIKRNHNISLARSLPSVFIDKAFDTIAILFIVIILPFSAIELSSSMMVLLGLLIVVFLLTLLLLISAAWQKTLVTKVLQYPVRLLPVRFRGSLNQGIETFVNELNLFEHHPLRLVAATGLTAIGVLLDGLYFFLLFKAFGVPYPFPLALFGYTLINLSYALPQPPAQLGSNEWMMIIIFSVGFGLTKTTASAIMAFAHILTATLMTFWGALAFLKLGPEIISKIFKGEKIDD